MKSRLAALFLALLMLSGCANDYKKVSVNSCRILNCTEFGLKQGRMHAVLGVELDICNLSGSKFEITEAKAVIFDKDGTEFGTVASTVPAVIEPNKRQPVTIHLDFAVNDPMELLFGGMPPLDDKSADLYVSARQNGIGLKRMEWKKIPLDTVMKQIKLNFR